MEKIITPTELQEVDFDLTRNRVLGTKTKYQREQAESKKTNVLDVMNDAPTWMKSLWRHKDWTEEELNNIIELLKSDNLCIIGDGSVKDQWGAVAWMICSKSSFSEVCTITHPVDGTPSNMKQIRAEATYAITALSMIHLLQKITHTKHTTIPVYTSCQGLIKRVFTENINSPSNVMADHIDIIYQIQYMIKKYQ